VSVGQPGHYNLSRGVISAVSRVRPVEVTTLAMKLRFGLGRNILRFWLNHARSPGSIRYLRLFYQADRPPDGGCDLIVSTGGKTSFANAWLSHCMQVPSVFVGSLRRLSADLFTVVVTLEPIQGADSNLVVTLPPSGIRYEKVRQQGEQYRLAHGLQDCRCWTVLIGGNGAGYRYEKQDWLALARLLNRLGQRYGIRWLLVTSRRTGQEAEALLRSSLDDNMIAAACWYGNSDQYEEEAWLGAAERVFVTEDSMTMLTEAIYSRRPVYSLWPQQAVPTDRYESMVQRFSDKGMICRQAIAKLEQRPESLRDSECKVLEESPLVELSLQLGKRLGLL